MEQATGSNHTAGAAEHRAEPDEYTAAEVHRYLIESGLAEQGLTVNHREHTLVLCGEVESARRRTEIIDSLAGQFPGINLQVDIGITRAGEPTEVEELL